MPLLFSQKEGKETVIAVWEMKEDNSHFLDRLPISEQNKIALEAMREYRKSEWLSSRYLLSLLLGPDDYSLLKKSDKGKPYIEGKDLHISLSHSQNFSAAIVSNRPVGIDIQYQETKITKLAHKFVSAQEAEWITEEESLHYYHTFWGIKESMYKAYGLKELDFKKHLHIYPFKIYGLVQEFKGHVRKDDIFQLYNLYSRKIKDCHLNYCLLDI